MRKLLFALISLYACYVQANCDEKWESASYQQNLNSFQVKEKTYFHSTPDGKSKINNLFLISGDSFTGYVDYNDFAFGKYVKKNGDIVLGWLSKDNLAEIPKAAPVNEGIKKSDFAFYSPFGDITLSSSFEDFYKKWGGCVKNEQQETGLWSSYISKGDINYKYFDHFWKGFTIRSSNINYNELGSDFDTYRITTITVTNSKYLTSRGIYVGMTVDNVKNAYGEPSEANNTLIRYNLKNYALDFTLENNIIKTISMDEQIQ